MQRLLFILFVVTALAIGCGPGRMAPFAPHRPDTDFHQGAVTKQACLECHDVAKLRGGHQASEDCLRCHRILHGDRR